MDPLRRDLDKESEVENIIFDGTGDPPNSLYLRNNDREADGSDSGEADGSGDGEAGGSGDGEAGSSDDGEAGGSDDGEAAPKSRGPTKKLSDKAHFTITVISERGEPLEPKKAASTFRKQCSVMVRDRIPVTVREWNKTKKAKESEYIAERLIDANVAIPVNPSVAASVLAGGSVEDAEDTEEEDGEEAERPGP